MNPLNTFTKKKILRAACTLARRHGIDRVTKKHIAEHLNCGMGTVNYHCGTMKALRKDVIAAAKNRPDYTRLILGESRAK